MDPENISHNASDYEQNLSSASPTIPPSDNEIEFGNLRKRLPNHHHLHHIDRRASLTEKFERDEIESDPMHRDDLDASSDRVAISPILSGGDQSRKRRKDSSCDNILSSLPLKRHHRSPSESHVSIDERLKNFFGVCLLILSV